MTTSLKFVGPADLSLGNIRISGANGLVQQWMATPEQRTMFKPNINPGYYIAEIEPAGVSARSVVFAVEAGQANIVSLPDFSFLTANGSGTTFLGVKDPDQAMTSLFGYKAIERRVYPLDTSGSYFESIAAHKFLDDHQTHTSAKSPEVRLLSVGLSMEQPNRREGWSAFGGSFSAELAAGAVALNIVPPVDWTAHSGRRARLTVAIEGVRIERLLLPLYRGGTTVRLTASPSSANDVTLDVTPSDPAIRALWRAIDAGTRDHAAAVRDQILKVKGPEPISALEAADPWEAMLAGLLYLRFPEQFGPLSSEWADALCKIHPWAADSYVIRAKQASAAVALAPESMAEKAALAVRMLTKAQSRGSPYFTLSNQFFNELVESLMTFDALGASARAAIERAVRRWRRELPLQLSAGTSFSWVSRDPELLKTERILAPKRKVSGRLRANDTAIIFKGLIKGGTISVETQTATAPKRVEADPSLSMARSEAEYSRSADNGIPEDCPALHRKITSPDDPNHGRFGGKARVGGFSLFPHFLEDNAKAVAVQLLVEADDASLLTVGDSAWFCLHPTFFPDWVRVYFRGRTAVLPVKAWGGFTVGVWLPSQNIELEYDLAAAPDAPTIIRTR